MTCKKKSFDNLIILQNFRFIAHTVGFCNGTDYPTRIPAAKELSGISFVTMLPAPITQLFPIVTPEQQSRLLQTNSHFRFWPVWHNTCAWDCHLCLRSDPVRGAAKDEQVLRWWHSGQNIIIADFDEGVILYGKIEIGKKVFANGSVPSVMKENRSLHTASFAMAL